MPELSKTHRVLALDLKGFGWTDPARRATTRRRPRRSSCSR